MQKKQSSGTFQAIDQFLEEIQPEKSKVRPYWCLDFSKRKLLGAEIPSEG